VVDDAFAQSDNHDGMASCEHVPNADGSVLSFGPQRGSSEHVQLVDGSALPRLGFTENQDDIGYRGGGT